MKFSKMTQNSLASIFCVETHNAKKYPQNNPCFFRFPCIFRFAIFLVFFAAFLLSFPRILGARQIGKSLLFSGVPCSFYKQKLTTVKYRCTEVRVYHAECGEQLGRDPSKLGSSKSLVLMSFAGEGLLVSLIFWDTPVLFTPPLPLPPTKKTG